MLLRILMMGFAPGVALGAAFLVVQSAIPAVFTQDPGVIAAVTHIVPLLALAMVRVLLAVCLCWAWSRREDHGSRTMQRAPLIPQEPQGDASKQKSCCHLHNAS